MTSFQCKRCGTCCTQFHHQIRYFQPEISTKFNGENSTPKITLFQNLMQKQTQEKDDEFCFFVPTRGDLESYLRNPKGLSQDTIDLIKQILPTIAEKGENTCMFLEDNGGVLTCTIHDQAPEMCKNYPKNQGNVCLGQKERYGTREFFEFQKKRLQEPIRVLKEIYKEKIQSPLAYDILTHLMDYGMLPYEMVENFFVKEFKTDTKVFGLAVVELRNESLVKLIEKEPDQKYYLQSVTYDNVLALIDYVMKQMGWQGK